MDHSDVYESANKFHLFIQEEVEAADFPQYAYGIIQAAALARAQHLPSVSVLELGVAGGNGLVEMERLALRHSEISGIEISVFGFDLGAGMPAAQDYRDMPHIWQNGFYQMDEARLRNRIKSASLIIGDIASTAPVFLRNLNAPIGFISFDLDYYSSTVKALDTLISSTIGSFLPRVVCYFDDTVGPHLEMHTQHTGELLAIQEFNERNTNEKIGKINGLRYKLLPYEGEWIEGMYVLQMFDHSSYCNYVYPDASRQFPLI